MLAAHSDGSTAKFAQSCSLQAAFIGLVLCALRTAVSASGRRHQETTCAAWVGEGGMLLCRPQLQPLKDSETAQRTRLRRT
jgi:hypothetical protein